MFVLYLFVIFWNLIKVDFIYFTFAYLKVFSENYNIYRAITKYAVDQLKV